MTINYDSECAPRLCVCVCCLLGGVKLLMNMLNVSLAYSEEKEEGREREGGRGRKGGGSRSMAAAEHQKSPLAENSSNL